VTCTNVPCARATIIFEKKHNGKREEGECAADPAQRAQKHKTQGEGGWCTTPTHSTNLRRVLVSRHTRQLKDPLVASSHNITRPPGQ